MAKVINVYNVPEGRALRVPVGQAFVNVHGCSYLDGIEGLEEVLAKRIGGAVESIAYVRGQNEALLLANAMNLDKPAFKAWVERYGLSSSEEGVAEACFDWVMEFLTARENVEQKERHYHE